jgi:predicted alpha/beta-hydrolase family hydrolase
MASLERLGATAYPASASGFGEAVSAGHVEAVLVLAHGAGAGQKHPFMVATAKGLAARRISVVTFDFPYMRERRHAPDKAPVLEASFREVIDATRLWSGRNDLFIGGKSMGGRMATHLGAQGLEGLLGIVALGYPLHPPGRPDKPRTEHLPLIRVPVLIVQGERDAFGTPDELRPVIGAMKANTSLHVVRGGDHSLTVRGKKKDEAFQDALEAIADWVRAGTR